MKLLLRKKNFWPANYAGRAKNFTKKLGVWILFLSGFVASSTQAQTISTNITIVSQSLPTLNICSGQSTFVVRVNNASASVITGVTFRDSLPPGINYVAGSVSGTGVTFGSTIIANNVVTFNVASIPAGGFIDVSFAAAAGCSAPTVSANVTNTYRASWSTFTTGPITTATYTLNFPSLSISSVTNATYSGVCFSGFKRTYIITNGGVGPVDSLIVTDVNGAGLAVNGMAPGTFTNTSASAGRLVVRAAQFAAVGNADGKLDQNESITITDTLTMGSTSPIAGTLTAVYGCQGNVCTNGTSNNVFSVNASLTQSTATITSTITTSNIDSIPYFGRTTNVRMVFKNTSSVPALNVTVYPGAQSSRYFDTTQLLARYNLGVAYRPSYSVNRPMSDAVGIGSRTFLPNPIPNGGAPSILRVNLGTINAGDSIVITVPLTRQYVSRVDGSQGFCCVWPNSGAFYAWFEGFALSPVGIFNGQLTGCPTVVTDFIFNGASAEQIYNGISLTPIPMPANGFNSYAARSLSLFRSFSFQDSTNLNSAKCTNTVGDTLKLLITANQMSLPMFNNKSKLTIKIKLDPGLAWDGNVAGLRGFINTSATAWIPSQVINTISVDSTLSIVFLRPTCPNSNFGTDNIYTGFFKIPLRLINVCTSTSASSKGIGLTRVFDIDTTMSHPVEAGPLGPVLFFSSTCSQPCTEGINIISYSSLRTTYDRADNDANGIPDGSIDMTRVATNLITWGDTMAIRMRMVVKTAQGGGVPYLYLNTLLNSTVANDFLSRLPASIRIKTAAGVIYTGTSSSIATKSGASSLTNLSLQGAGGVTIAGYTSYNNLDTIDLLAPIVYFKKVNDGSGVKSIDVTQTPYTSIVPNPTGAQQFKCDSSVCGFKVIGIQQSPYASRAESHNLCADSSRSTFIVSADGVFGAEHNCGGANVFPFELRNIAYPTLYKVHIPPSTALVVSRIFITYHFTQPGCQFVQLNGGSAIPTSLYSIVADSLVIDFKAILQFYGYDIATFNRINMGQYFVMAIDFKKTDIGGACNLDHVNQGKNLVTSTYFVTSRPTEVWEGLAGTRYTNTLFARFSGNQSLNDFNISLLASTLTATSPQLPIDLTIATNSGTSFTWIGAALKPGQSIDSVRDMGTNTLLTTVAGTNVYQIGSLAGSITKNYRIFLKIASCVSDSIMIFADRTPCSGYPTNLSTSNTCKNFADSIKFKYNTIAGELLLAGSIYTTPKDICTADTLQMIVNNTQSPTAKTVVMNMDIPSGVVFNAGTAQMRRGNGAWLAAADPTMVTSIRYTFAIPAADTLLGSSFSPDNKVSYRVGFNTTCSFISGSQIQTSVNGTVACGPVTSLSNSNPAPLMINGAITPYSTVAKATVAPITGCDVNNAGYRYDVSLKLSGVAGTTTGVADSTFVVLPATYKFVSYSNVASGSKNAPVPQPVITTQGDGTIKLAFEVPANVNVSDSIKFAFMYNEVANTPNKCTASPARRTSVSSFYGTSLFCASTNANCPNVLVQTGTDTISFVSLKPLLSASLSSATYSKFQCTSNCNKADTLKLSGTIQNTGTAAFPAGTPLYMEVFMDINNNGTIDAGVDSAFKIFTTSVGVATGSSIPFTYQDTVKRNCTPCDGKPILVRFTNIPPGGGGTSQCLCTVTMSSIFPNNVVLPLRLLSFTGAKDGKRSKLDWRSANDQSLQYYILERSKDGISFTSMVEVTSKQSNLPTNYTAFDESPFAGFNYYRLVGIDLSGKSAYSNIIRINFGDDKRIVSVYPSPAKESLTLQLSEISRSAISVRIFNVAGQLVMSETIPANTSGKKLDVSTLAKGGYILELKGNEYNQYIRFIKE